ncbi:hypothetical protein SEA_MARKY_30 [Streptomyces phage Marky]|nr:hypothetical protein SEA_MARKY_30 [Streptomyces phage Marky]
MARNIYGASGAAQVVSLTGTPTLAAATVKTARTGGTTVTDILNMAGANIAGVVTPDSRGQIIFQGPDNSTATYWLDFGDGGPRWAVSPVDFTALVSTAIAAREVAQNAAPGSATPEAALPYVDNTAFENLALALEGKVTPKFASASARDTAYASPSDGDTCYRTDLHARQSYRTLAAGGRWVTENQLIDEVVLGSDTASISFQNIPQDWRHLVIKFRARAVGSNALYVNSQPVGLRLNNDSGTNYGVIGFVRNMKLATGTFTWEVTPAGGAGAVATTAAVFGSAAGGLTNVALGAQSAAWCGYCTGSAFSTLQGGGEIRIDDYTNSATRKPIQGSTGYNDSTGAPSGTGYSAYSVLQAGWLNNNAITRIDLLPISATGFASGSRFSLYGLS